MSLRLARLGLLVLLVAAPGLVAAQTVQVGQVAGVVTDGTGGRLPGATVTMVSVERGFTRTTTTGADGAYSFPLVTLGRYDIEVTLAGFKARKVTGNLVEAEKTTAVHVMLEVGGVTESTTVIGEIPIVDATNQTLMTRVRSQEFELLPVGRSYQTLTLNAPGVVASTGGNINVHGAIREGNQFMMDGVVSTDPTTGTFSGNVNFEAISEVVIRTAGVSAEFGRATGAYVDVITKSGSNQLSGSAKMLLINDQWDAQNKVKSEVAAADGTFASLARTRFDKVNKTYSFTLGGPIVRNRAWFFGAFEDSRSVTPKVQLNSRPGITPEEFQQDRVIQYPNIRGTVQLTPSQSFWVKYAADPFTGIVRNDYWSRPAEREALTSQEQGGKLVSGQYTAVLGSKWTAEVMGSYKTSRITVEPFERTQLNNGAPYYDLSDGRAYNGATFDGYVSRPRAQVGVATSYFTNLGGHSHALKFGLDVQNVTSENAFRYPNNQVYYGYDFDPVSRTFAINDSYEEYEDAPSRSTGTLVSFYARDKFQAGARLSFELGVRMEHQGGKSDVGVPTVSTTNVAPRLSMSYAVTDDAKTLVNASYGRYYDGVLQTFSDTFANVPQQENYKTYAWTGSGYTYVSEYKAGANNFKPDTAVTPRHMDEFTIGAERQLGNRLGVNVRYIQRGWGNFIDDIKAINADGSLNRTVTNITNGKRTYKGLELGFDRRFGNNWTASGNYTYSVTKGNHLDTGDNFTLLGDYLGANCRQTVDRGLFGAGVFSCGELQTNLYGKYTFDRPHLLKFSGAYTRTFGALNFVAGLAGSALSKTRFEKQRSVTILTPAGAQFGTATYFYEPRGSQRVPGLLDVYDVNLEFGWKGPRTSTVALRLETFNVFNNQEKVSPGANVAWCNSTETATCAANVNAFGLATVRGSFNGPRTYRAQLVFRY